MSKTRCLVACLTFFQLLLLNSQDSHVYVIIFGSVFATPLHPQTKMLWQLSEMTSPRSEHGRIGLHCGPFIWLHASLFVRGTLFGEVRLLLLVASVVLVKSVSLFVAGAIFGEVGVSAMTG